MVRYFFQCAEKIRSRCRAWGWRGRCVIEFLAKQVTILALENCVQLCLGFVASGSCTRKCENSVELLFSFLVHIMAARTNDSLTSSRCFRSRSSVESDVRLFDSILPQDSIYSPFIEKKSGLFCFGATTQPKLMNRQKTLITLNFRCSVDNQNPAFVIFIFGVRLRGSAPRPHTATVGGFPVQSCRLQSYPLANLQLKPLRTSTSRLDHSESSEKPLLTFRV